MIVAVAAVGALLFADAARGDGAPAAGASAARIRLAALACGFGILLVGPAIWSVDTLGHPTSGTFPAGGPESASAMGGPGGRRGQGWRWRRHDAAARAALRRPAAAWAAPKAAACATSRRRNRTASKAAAAAEGGSAASSADCRRGGPPVDGRGRRAAARRDVRRRRPQLDPRIHRSPRRRDDRGRQPVGRLRPRSSKQAPKWPASAASPAKSPRSAPPGWKNGSTPARSPGSTPAASATTGGAPGGPGGGESARGGDTRTGSESAIDTVVKSAAPRSPSSAYGSTRLRIDRRIDGRGRCSSGTLYRCGES